MRMSNMSEIDQENANSQSSPDGLIAGERRFFKYNSRSL